MDPLDPTKRLTEREKEALRAWLEHKSAKEIAIELGITHHAVEKRLKMARTKLDAGSSLEAARMLVEVEGKAEQYQRTVTGPPDLPPAQPLRPTRHSRNLVVGGFAVLTLTVLGLALAAAYPSAEPTEIEIDGDLEKVFAHLDDDDSGFLESPESPFVTIEFAEGSGSERREGTANISDGTDPDQVAEFYSVADTDRDGRVSYPEYRGWSEARWAEMGIEIKMIMKVLPSPQS